MRMKSVILIGCGNIGFRHLQALVQLDTPIHLTIVEPNEQGWDRIRALLKDAGDTHQFDLQARLPDNATEFALAVVATSAMHRRGVIEDLLNHHKVDTMILEKVLFQRLEDFDAVGARLDQAGVSVFVNCGRRYFEGYRALRAELSPKGPIDLLVTGNVYGLGSNAVHFLDLAEFLNGAPLTKVDTTGLLEGAITAKRAGCIELFGTLTAQLANGARVTVDCRPMGPISVETQLSVGSEGVIVNEVARRVLHGTEDSAFAMKNVSEYPEIYSDALAGRSALVPYIDSCRQHKFFLSAVLDHLGLPDTADCAVS